MDVLSEFRKAPMSRFQVGAVAIALTLIMIDGFDVAVMAYAAPAISREWGIEPVLLGFLLSGSLFGMAAGSIFLTPLADRIGRRRLTLISLVIISIGMILSVLSAGPAQLLSWRVLTGLGVGGMMANLNVLVAEYASDRRRGTIIGIYTAGYPIGATIGGLVAAPLLPVLSWHYLFGLGAALTIIMLVVSWRWLPESLDYLVTRRPDGALEQVNAILRRLHQPTLADMPPVPATVRQDSAVREVLTSPVLFRTLMLWLGYACLVAAYYFANTWTPRIMATVLGSDSLGVTTGMLANAGGIIGCVIFSLLALRLSTQRLLVVALAGAAVAYVVFAMVFDTISVAMILAVALGALTTAGIAGFYAVSPGVYSPRARATGVGWMIGLGRLVSIVAPIMVGYLVAGGWTPQSIFTLFAGPLLVSALAMVALGVSLRRRGATIATSPVGAAG